MKEHFINSLKPLFNINKSNLAAETQFGLKSTAPKEHEHFNTTQAEGICKPVYPTDTCLLLKEVAE